MEVIDPKLLASFKNDIISVVGVLECDAGQEARDWGRKARETWNALAESEAWEGSEDIRNESNASLLFV